MRILKDGAFYAVALVSPFIIFAGGMALMYLVNSLPEYGDRTAWQDTWGFPVFMSASFLQIGGAVWLVVLYSLCFSKIIEGFKQGFYPNEEAQDVNK